MFKNLVVCRPGPGVVARLGGGPARKPGEPHLACGHLRRHCGDGGGGPASRLFRRRVVGRR